MTDMRRALPFVGFLLFFFWGLNSAYPLLGHDFFEFLPRLLAGKWHFAHQGFSPFLYTPHFCGGMPQYANPQGMYYSFQQLFSLFFDLWFSVQLATLLFLLLGYFGWYKFSRDVCALTSSFAHLLALIILANGYYVLHIAAGHIASLTLPLIGMLLWLLLSPHKEKGVALFAHASLFALLSSIILYSGGYLVLLYTALLLGACLPVLLLLTDDWKKRGQLFVRRIGIYGAFAFVLCASKLVAVWSFMRFFPRELSFKTLPTGGSTVLFIVRALWEMPQRVHTFALEEIGVHEYSNFLSPVTLIGLLLGLVLLVRKKEVLKQKRMVLLTLFSVLATLFFISLVRGEGVLVDWLQPLPLFASLHIMVRFLYIPAILLSIVSVIALARFVKDREGVALLCSVITIVSLVAAYAPLLRAQPDPLKRTLDYSALHALTEENASSVTEVVSIRGLAGFMNLAEGFTNTYCYEPLFGMIFGGLHEDPLRASSTLQPGPVTNIRDGFFNMQHPACFLYPKENDCEPWDHIALDDSANLFRFLEGKKVTWKMSSWQHGANALSLLGLLVSFCGLVWGIKSANSYRRTREV